MSRRAPARLWLGLAFTAVLTPQPAFAAGGPGTDVRLSYVSALDGTEQPYRVYVPAAHDGRRPLPLVFALHGTGGNEATLFDEPNYQQGALRRAAEHHGVLVVSPLGRG